jgi:cytochrome c biogenesis protein CcmG, thiol:disulfide interchange protein DsbE
MARESDTGERTHVSSACEATSTAGRSIPTSEEKRRSHTLLVAVLVALALVAGLLTFGLTRDPTLIRSPLLGRLAPDFSLRTQGGDPIRLSDLRGHVVVVNFWASWCIPCREEHPDLLAAWNRYRDHGLVLLGVIYQDSPGNARQFMQENGGDWPILEDPGGEVSIDYGVYGAPETFFIGPDGRIADKRVGASSFEQLSNRISGLLERAGP